jgi:hypothetical protein
MRKIYENATTVSAETIFAEDIQERWKGKLCKLPRQYHLDFTWVKDNVIHGFVELKNRTNEKDTYPTYMISLSKVLKAKELSKASGLPSILAVRWKDSDGYVNLHDVKFDLGFGGRYDRGDWQDIEPVALIDIANFKSI